MNVEFSPVLIPPSKLPIISIGTDFTQCIKVATIARMSIRINAFLREILDTSYEEPIAPNIAPH